MNVRPARITAQPSAMRIVSTLVRSSSAAAIMVTPRMVRNAVAEQNSSSDGSVSGNFNAIYAAVQGNQTCKIYDQCVANGIDCGGGKCLNNTIANELAKCYCNSPLTLLSISINKFDCVCPTTTDFFDGTTCKPRPNADQGKEYSLRFHQCDSLLLQVYPVIPNSRSESIAAVRMRP